MTLMGTLWGSEQTIKIRIPNKLLDQLRTIGQQHNMPLDDVILRALAKYAREEMQKLKRG